MRLSWGGIIATRGLTGTHRIPHGSELPMPSECNGDHQELTAAEREVLMLVAEGRTDAEIATALRLTTGTVAQRIHRFCDRTGIHGRLLVVWTKDHRDCCVASA